MLGPSGSHDAGPLLLQSCAGNETINMCIKPILGLCLASEQFHSNSGTPSLTPEALLQTATMHSKRLPPAAARRSNLSASAMVPRHRRLHIDMNKQGLKEIHGG